MRRLPLIAVVVIAVVLAQALVSFRNLTLVVMHRWYHRRSGRGWHCPQCARGEHVLEVPKILQLPERLRGVLEGR